ncbi:hypothetical protein BHE74_00033333 [Ensete ventricosum]|nr:hypothetical protein BHE74_00033333 [Ensete ventricosum]
MEIRPSWEEVLAFPTTKIVGEVEVDEEDIEDVESKEKQSSHRLSQSMARDRDYLQQQCAEQGQWIKVTRVLGIFATPREVAKVSMRREREAV